MCFWFKRKKKKEEEAVNTQEEVIETEEEVEEVDETEEVETVDEAEEEVEEVIETEEEVEEVDETEEEVEEVDETEEESEEEEDTEAVEKGNKTTASGGKKVYHVSKRASDNKWTIKFASGKKVIRTFDRKDDAMKFAKELAESQGGVVLFHASKGENKGRIVRQGWDTFKNKKEKETAEE